MRDNKTMINDIKKYKLYFLFTVFSVLFTLFGFATLELYITNRSEFWFGISNILLPAAILCGALLLLTLIFVNLIPDKGVRFFTCLVTCINFALYLQGNFWINDYGELNGNAVDWNSHIAGNTVNSVFWVAFIVAAILLYRFGGDNIAKILYLLCLCLFLTQLLSLLAISVIYKDSVEKENVYISRQGEFLLSDNRNIIVFVLDAFDAEVMEELLRTDYEDVTSGLEDFKYYRDTVGGATRTKYAIPYILFGDTNREEIPYLEYVERSTDQSPLINELLKNRYDSRIYTEDEYVDISRADIINNVAEGKAEVADKTRLLIRYMQLVTYRYSPNIMKRRFWMYSGDFEEYKYSDSDKGAYGINDADFYHKLITQKIHTSEVKPVFRFYHLNGAHPPYVINENCKHVKLGNSSELKQAKGSLNIVKEYISQMKKLGIYEDSTIVVMADHGSERGFDQNPLFMIKELGASCDFKQVDGRFSYSRLAEYLGDIASGKEVTIDDYMTEGTRYFYIGSEQCGTMNIVEYASEGEAWNAEAFFETGNVYHSGTLNRSFKYNLGTKLRFTSKATANAYAVTGLANNEGTHTWTNGHEVEMKFKIEEPVDSDLVLNMDYWIHGAKQQVIINVNGNYVYDYIAYGNESVNVVIPMEYVKNDEIVLRFELPDAYDEDYDSRVMALAMKSITISKR